MIKQICKYQSDLGHLISVYLKTILLNSNPLFFLLYYVLLSELFFFYILIPKEVEIETGKGEGKHLYYNVLELF